MVVCDLLVFRQFREPALQFDCGGAVWNIATEKVYLFFADEPLQKLAVPRVAVREVPGLIEFFDGVMADFFEAVNDDLAEHWLYLSDNGGSVHGITGQQQTSRTSAKIKHFVAWLATPTQGFFVEGDGLHRGVFIENSRHALSEPQLEDVEDVICNAGA